MRLTPAKTISKFYYLALSIFIFLISNDASAQLQANFSVDKTGGCSPLNVKFTNTTTGATPTATWQWNFGNANSSTLRDPGATYFTEKTYTVTLTVKDGANTSTKSLDVSVYKKPVVDFSLTPAKGCAPLSVNFTANATAGDGTIASYLWDFGDGTTVQGSNYATTQHIYTLPQVPPITLNVTNSFGCYATVTKSNQVEVVKAVQATFTPSETALCNAGESVTFTNNSTGSGTLTYKWDFGDGKTSTVISPVHIYSTSGSFTATLTTTSSDGCSATAPSVVINVANFIADFQVPSLICLNQGVLFTNTSTTSFRLAEWWVDGNFYGGGNYTDAGLNTAFYQPGDHTIKLVMYYGNCSVTSIKKITVNALPNLNGFLVALQGACGAPVTINYKDTTSDAVSWQWRNNYYGSTFATTRNAAFTYTSNGYEEVYLTVTNAAGCSATAAKYVNYDKPNIYISITSTNTGNYQGCTGLKLGFAANPDTAIKDYSWDFGDGTTLSTVKTPTHTFNKAGSFTVTLNYTTTNGCKGVAYYNTIAVVDKPVFDFTSQNGTTICGNTPTTFAATPAASGWDYLWSFNSQYEYYGYYGNSTIVKQFVYDTTYTVMMIANNHGCVDTVIKKDYIKVLPPFPHIGQVLNTCDGTRGAVRLTEHSDKALKWSWDFGDGGTDAYAAFKDTIRHTYTKTGSYNVVLSATNGACTVKDSINVYVLLKQKPVLTSLQTNACGSDNVNYKLGGFEVNPYYVYSYGYYYISSKEYGDLTPYNGYMSLDNYSNQVEYTGYMQSLDPGKSDIRMITTSYGFGCADTSNFIPLKIHGPKAGYSMQPHSGCFKDPVFFSDTSRAFTGSPLVKWEWNFGDGKLQTLTTTGSTSHLYALPGYYYVQLKVTDADGCTSTSNFEYVSLGGPKADFSATSYNIPPNTLVSLFNISSYYNSYYNSSLKWIFPDSTTSTYENTSFNFTKEGVYTIRLITYNSETGCTDTIQKTFTVREVNSVFTYKFSYINNNSCPPVIASFTSISTNAVRLAWDFGDGGVAGNQTNVSHTYNKPGIYRVVHYSFDSGSGVDSTEDFIEVKGPYALLKADVLTGCSSLQVKLTADVRYANDYTWDFGDGTVVPTTDTFAIHTYLTPGIYVPALILKDAGGCNATSELPEKVVVDSLLASFKISPNKICDSGVSIFTSTTKSLSNDELQAALEYRWIVKEGNRQDTSYTFNGNHFFNILATHTVSLLVKTPYGCEQEVTESVVVNSGVSAVVNGLAEVCKDVPISFTGSANPSNVALQWKWDLGNGNVSDQQNPGPQQYSITGLKQVSLQVSNGNCSDTAIHPLFVNAPPVIGFSPQAPVVCNGSSFLLTASGGESYKWFAPTTIANTNTAGVTSRPVKSIYYSVNVTDTKGCKAKDSVFVKVIDSIKVSGTSSLFACEGTSVQLNVSGANTYKWINNTTGISNTAIANPSALANISTTYTVVGYDNFNCFTDTANISVRISKLPLVDAGPGSQLIANTPFTLSPTISGATNWAWSPSDFLSCTNCLNPISKPNSSITYTLTAFNSDGCKATDTVSLRLICGRNLLYIPTAFSPNNDNLNDRFTIHGSGVKIIRSIIVFNRWGKVVFERKNINANDPKNSWDGYYNGEPMPVGAYVYLVQTECEAGEVFEYRGNVMIVR